MTQYNPMLVITTILLQTLFIALVNLKICTTQDISNLKTFLFFSNLITLVLSGFVIISIKQILENTRRQIESSLLKKHLQDVEDLVKALNAERHEYTRHVQTLQAMIYLDEVDAAKEYIDGIAENYWHLQDIVYVGDLALSALLASKRKVAETKSIEFDFALKCDITHIGIEKWELCSIIGNLLDNALEAVQNQTHRRVTMEIKSEKAQYVIYVYNTGAQISELQKEKLFEPGYTTRGSEARGFGLYIVKKLVDKYNGTITVITKPKTTFIVCLPDKGAGIVDKKNIDQDCKIFGGTAAS